MTLFEISYLDDDDSNTVLVVGESLQEVEKRFEDTTLAELDVCYYHHIKEIDSVDGYDINVAPMKSREAKLLNEYEYWHDLKDRDYNTLSTEEKLLLKYRSILFSISEICVDESKHHVDSSATVDKIRDKLGEMNNDRIIFNKL